VSVERVAMTSQIGRCVQRKWVGRGPSRDSALRFDSIIILIAHFLKDRMFCDVDGKRWVIMRIDEARLLMDG
jgi:hypothetical protein